MKPEFSHLTTSAPDAGKSLSGLLMRLQRPGPPMASSLMSMRHLHDRVMARHQLQLSLAQPLQHAGPLHSARLAQQALQRLQHIAPAYVQRFMLYADALRALEDAHALKPKGGKDKASLKKVRRRQPG